MEPERFCPEWFSLNGLFSPAGKADSTGIQSMALLVWNTLTDRPGCQSRSVHPCPLPSCPLPGRQEAEEDLGFPGDSKDLSKFLYSFSNQTQTTTILAMRKRWF